MTAPTLQPHPAPAAEEAPTALPGRPIGTTSASPTGRAWLALVVAGVLTIVAGAAVLAATLRGPAVVTPRFAGGDAMATEWGNAEAWGRPGSWVLGYRDGSSMTMVVPWSGGPVEGARLGAGPVDLATITAAEVQDGELVVTIGFDGCDYFHERELQVFPTMTVVTSDGGTTQVTFDRPLFVRSPMLWQCPDRRIDRWARNRSDL